MTREQIEQMPAGPEINALIEAEIFGAIPLTDEEWELCRATWMMVQGPPSAAHLVRLLKVPLDEPQYETKLMIRLQWPSDYSSDSFGSSRRIVDKMRADGWRFAMEDEAGGIVSVSFFRSSSKGWIRTEAIANTEALAICRAALKAMLSLNK